MVTVAIISEYNPFHLGHEYQIKKIREEFGNDTAIVAIMSGNYTQRGEIAIADKFLRAKTAVLSGVNLVLELPFPYSLASAEFFASAGVHIANSLGVVDYLSFGTELGNIDSLVKIAKHMMTEQYVMQLNTILSSDNKIGYPQACEMAFTAISNSEVNFSFTPNNILAIEYIKALIKTESTIQPHTVKRTGSNFNDIRIKESPFPSAMAIRQSIYNEDFSALKYLPDSSKNELSAAFTNRELPTNEDKLSAAIISYFRLNPDDTVSNIHDAEGGLYNRIRNASYESDNISNLIALSQTKKYTTARIRRAMWYSFFGVTSSDLKMPPYYTQVLALDKIGQEVLKGSKSVRTIPILTKPSAIEDISDDKLAMRTKSLSDKADSVFQLTKPSFYSGNFVLKCTPYVKK